MKENDVRPYDRPRANSALPRPRASQLGEYVGVEIGSSFAVLSKQLRKMKKNNPFLQLQLADVTGQVGGNIWNNALKADEAFEAGHVLEIRGLVSMHQKQPQLNIQWLRRVCESEINPANYPPGTTGKPDEFASPSDKNYSEPGEWVQTDDNIGIAIKSMQNLEGIKQRYGQSGREAAEKSPLTPRPSTTPEMVRQKLSDPRLREIRKRYSPAADNPSKKGQDF